MSFDKTKAMKNAERFLSQGKLRSAIGEYKKVIDDNPKDFSTLNIMGDLFVKNSDIKEAVNCYREVAEYYYGQGFSNKAIAIYNKIARLEPDLTEISKRLAQLYQMRGSNAEAREQYLKLAENYQSKGMKLEALDIWKRIADLDPNNTEVYMTIAATCIQENQHADAVDAFAEAGFRFNSQEKYEAAVGAFSKALAIQSNSVKALKGFVAAKIGLGCADEAAETLERVLIDNPYSREILLLLTDCYLDLNAPGKAEETVLKLVQQEPSHFPKFLEIVKVYMKENDFESTVRVLSISFEHLLGAGLADDLIGWINEVLTRNPEYIDGLRLLVKYYSWHRNPVEIRKALNRLAEVARMNESVEDERYALGQLAAMSPLQTEYSERLDELKRKFGFAETEVPVEQMAFVPDFESFIALNSDDDILVENAELRGSVDQFNSDFSFSGDDDAEASNADDESTVVTDFSFVTDSLEPNYGEIIPDAAAAFEPDIHLQAETPQEGLSLACQHRLQKEVESVEFYVDQGYNDLALKCLESLLEEFGQTAQLLELRENILKSDGPAFEVGPQPFEDQPSEIEPDTGFQFVGEIAFGSETYSGQKSDDQPPVEAGRENESESNVEHHLTPDSDHEAGSAHNFENQLPLEIQRHDESLPEVEPWPESDVQYAGMNTLQNVGEISSEVNVFEQFRSDLGLGEFDEDNEGDYSTLYHTAIAYKEMGLTEDAIKEFQDAISMVEIGDGTRRYFQCANLLGHCFIMKGMPNLAISWFKRALETPGLIGEEIQALNYELADAYEASGEKDKAFQYFEQVYAVDVAYRDIGQRMQSLRETYSSNMIN